MLPTSSRHREVLLAACIALTACSEDASSTTSSSTSSSSTTSSSTTTPATCTLPQDTPRVVNIESDGNFTLALLSDGSITCWGEELAGSCAYGGGAGLVPSPSASKNVDCLVDVQVEEGFVAGIGQDGDLRLWGASAWEVFPDATELVTKRGLAFLEPRRVGSGVHYVVVETAQNEYFWTGSIPLLYGDQTPNLLPVLLEAPDWTQVALHGASRDISTSGQHICVLMETGELWCWGSNRKGQLNLPDVPYADTPTLIPAPELPVAVETDQEVTCILGESGSVYCTGTNSGAQLGRSYAELNASETFLQIEGLPPASELWVASGGACAMTVEGLWCWGQDGYAPAPIDQPVAPVDVALGRDTVCVLDAAGVVYCRAATLPTFLGRCEDQAIDWQVVDLNRECN